MNIKNKPINKFLILSLTVLATACTSTIRNPDSLSAALDRDLEGVKKSIQNGNDINAKNIYGETPLMHASGHGDIRIVRYLVENGADIHIEDSNGNCALTYAAYNGSADTVTYLLSVGADVNAKNNFGATPLMYALLAFRHKAISILLERGADPNIQTKSGLTSLMIAAGVGHVPSVEFMTKLKLKKDIKVSRKTYFRYGGRYHDSKLNSNILRLGEFTTSKTGGFIDSLEFEEGHTAIGFLEERLDSPTCGVSGNILRKMLFISGSICEKYIVC